MAGLSGWVSIDRKILDHWSASEPEALAVWIRLILEANHSDTKKLFNGTLTEIKRGQVVFGYPAFAQKSGVSVAKLRRIITMFEQDGMISRQKTNKYSLISITCYDKYQSTDRQTAGESQADNKQIAGKSQHRNNVNNENNEKTDTSQSPDKPDDPCVTPDQVAKIYNDRLGDILPACKALTDKRRSHIRGRIKDDAKRKDADWWDRYFTYVSQSPFLTGQGPERQNGKPWSADIEWLINPNNMAKVIEGNYHHG